MGESIDNRTVAALLRFTRGVSLELDTPHHHDMHRHHHDADGAAQLATTDEIAPPKLVEQAPRATEITKLSTPDYRPPLSESTRPNDLPIEIALVKAAVEYAKYGDAA